MFSRRQFLGSSAAAMIVGRAAGAFASASQRGDRGTAETGPLPPSIAALTSMRDQARPITNDERRARIERARQLMAQSKIDALMLARRHVAVVFREHALGRQRAAVRRA